MSDSLEFNTVLMDISNQLTAEELEKLKYLCDKDIGKRDLEKSTTGLKLFQLLKHRNKLGPGNTDYLSDRLGRIHRQDLRDKLEGIDGQTENQPDEAERARLNVATEVIAENLGKSWRKLGRKLGLSEVKLDSINAKHQFDLEEITVEMLKEWRKSQGARARVEDLTKALRDCQLKLTAEKVEARLETPPN
ncbi:FAS-associated death domain protein [Sphaeramia orbicularis]|uniref:Fas (tnfrsf6)-associated via death domain n=1 Tax=Sphaeramia orbicularis TaxID=375764 RepID=A0A672YC94_9TELE|nr:FAS-associated death domain protein [Sphaeramia orbicularis]